MSTKKNQVQQQDHAAELHTISKEIVPTPLLKEEEQLNSTQRQFRQLLQAIEEEKAYLKALKSNVLESRQKVAYQIQPLLEEIQKSQMALLCRLNEIHDTFRLTKIQRRTLAKFLLFELQKMDCSVKEEFIKSLLQKYYPEVVCQTNQQSFDQENQYADAHQETLKQHTDQLGREALLAKDLRAVYTSLAKVLHPDLEQNPLARQTKEELMKKIIQAYRKQDLYELLCVQRTYAASIDQLTPKDKLKQYCKLLRNQLNVVKKETQEYIASSEDADFIRQFFNHKHQFSPYKLRIYKNKLTAEITRLNQLVEMLSDEQGVAYFLKVVTDSYKQYCYYVE